MNPRSPIPNLGLTQAPVVGSTRRSEADIVVPEMAPATVREGHSSCRCPTRIERRHYTRMCRRCEQRLCDLPADPAVNRKLGRDHGWWMWLRPVSCRTGVLLGLICPVSEGWTHRSFPFIRKLL